MYRTSLLVAVGLSIGCGGGDAEGTLTYAMSGDGIAETRIIAKAMSVDASMTCQTFEATTDANGAFKIVGLCGGTAYKLTTSNDQLWLPDAEQVPDGGMMGVELKAWVASEGSGVYKLAGGTLNGVRSSTDLKQETLLESEEKVNYPARIPRDVALVAPGEYLVLSGKETMAAMSIVPLIPSGERKFAGRITMAPWSFIGVKFIDDETYEKVEAVIDEGKITTKEAGERAIRYIAHDALPVGRYAVYDASQERGVVTIVDFGKVTPKQEAPAEPVE